MKYEKVYKTISVKNEIKQIAVAKVLAQHSLKFKDVKTNFAPVL